MKIKYCPMCAGIDIKALALGNDQCNKCKHTGEMREGPMDEINSRKKSLQSGVIQPQPQGSGTNSSVSNSQLRERLNALKGKSTGDVDFL